MVESQPSKLLVVSSILTARSTPLRTETPVQSESAQLLRAIADLAVHAQSRPTDTQGIRNLRKARVRAETAWINAGCPDAAPGEGKPSPVPKAARRLEAENLLKDWTPVTVTVTVRRMSEAAALVTDDKVEAWLPRKLCFDPGTRDVTDLEEADIFEIDIPTWLAKEKELI